MTRFDSPRILRFTYVFLFDFAETDPLPPIPEGVNTIIGSLTNGSCAWSAFSAERVRYAVTIFRSGLFADSPIPDGGQRSGYFVPHAALRGDRSRPRKDKQVAVENDLGDFLASLGGECLGTGAAEPSTSDLPEVDPGYVPECAGAFEQANQVRSYFPDNRKEFLAYGVYLFAGSFDHESRFERPCFRGSCSQASGEGS